MLAKKPHLSQESSYIERRALASKFAVCRRPKDHHLTSRGLVDLNVAISIKPGLIRIRETSFRNNFVCQQQRQQARLNRSWLFRINEAVSHLLLETRDGKRGLV